MIAVVDLWLPILLSAVFVFVVSSLIHMVIPIHKGDYKKLPGESNVLTGMRAENVGPGYYMFPCAESMKAMGEPEMIAKFNEGPVGYVTVLPNGPPAIGKSLIQWFLYSLLIGLLVATVAALGLAKGDEFMTVFRFTTAAAILGYAVGEIPASIWKGMSWGITNKFVFDGVLYGLTTAATFAWLWPAAA